jgi:glycosyltransferase involved in cell wall biosynthesis
MAVAERGSGRPVRVAVLDHTAELGGAELALARLLDHMDGAGFDVTAVLFADGPLRSRLEEAGQRVEVVPLEESLVGVSRDAAGSFTGLRSAVRLVPFVVRLARRIRALDVDLIHTTSLKADLIGVPVALLARRPLVWHVHDRIAPDYLPGSMVRLVRLLARVAPRVVIANSEATAATLPGARGLTVAHPGLARDQIAERRTSPAPFPPVVGMVGRISPTKGQLEFVRAAAQVLTEVPNVRFRIIGEASFGHGDYESLVRSEVERLGLATRVDFPGFAPDPAAEMDRLTVCVHAATVPEPFGQVVAEAMGRCVPVVATRGGGVDEILGPSPDEVAWPVANADVGALARAIIDAVTHPDEAARRADAARASVAERFAVERTASLVTGIWTRAAQR